MRIIAFFILPIALILFGGVYLIAQNAKESQKSPFKREQYAKSFNAQGDTPDRSFGQTEDVAGTSDINEELNALLNDELASDLEALNQDVSQL